MVDAKRRDGPETMALPFHDGCCQFALIFPFIRLSVPFDSFC